MTQITARVETITPMQAAEWLNACNTHNRRLKDKLVPKLAADINEGRWRLNGEAIKFASDGTLLDGQNRLSAVVMAGRNVPMLVVRGLDRATQETMDTGVKRTMGDILTLRGEQNAATLGAVVRSVRAWDSGQRYVHGGWVGNGEILAYFDAHPELREAAAPARRIAGTLGLPSVVGGLAWVLFQRIDPADNEWFWEHACTPYQHKAGDPISEYRRTVEQARKARRDSTFLLAVTIKAWNKFRAGDTNVTYYSFKPGGSNPETMPEPK